MHPKSTTPCAECPKEEPKCCEEARRQDKEVPLGTGVLDKPGMSFTMEQSISSTEVDGTGELNGSGHYLVRSSSEHVNKVLLAMIGPVSLVFIPIILNFVIIMRNMECSALNCIYTLSRQLC